jgi:hypothetical protein
MMRTIATFVSLFSVFAVLSITPVVQAQSEEVMMTPYITDAEVPVVVEDAGEKVVIYFFDDPLCSTCAATKQFIRNELKAEYPNIELIILPITDTARLAEVAERYGVTDYRVMAPTVFVGEDYFFQFNSFSERQEELLRQAVTGELDNGEECCFFKIPFSNIEINVGGWSLIAISIILGAIDGFNVCSVGALILILSIVMVLNSKRLIFLYGGLFILTTVIVYGSLVFVWGKVFEALIGHFEILRIIVGLSALAGGVFFFKQFWRFYKYGPTCDSSGSPLVIRATERVQKVFSQPGAGAVALMGSIIFFAAAITLIELPCSIGVPIAYTGILVEHNLSLFAYTMHILLYLFFYMLDELIIFTGAVLTKKIWFAGSRTITWVTFVGAMVLFYLAFYYLFV